MFLVIYLKFSFNRYKIIEMEAQKRKMCKITGIWDAGRSCSGDDKAKTICV